MVTVAAEGSTPTTREDVPFIGVVGGGGHMRARSRGHDRRLEGRPDVVVAL